MTDFTRFENVEIMEGFQKFKRMWSEDFIALVEEAINRIHGFEPVRTVWKCKKRVRTHCFTNEGCSERMRLDYNCRPYDVALSPQYDKEGIRKC